MQSYERIAEGKWIKVQSYERIAEGKWIKVPGDEGIVGRNVLSC